MRREAFKFWDLVRLILETLRYSYSSLCTGLLHCPWGSHTIAHWLSQWQRCNPEGYRWKLPVSKMHQFFLIISTIKETQTVPLPVNLKSQNQIPKIKRFASRLVIWSTSSHYLNQCWNIFNSNLRNKVQWNLKRYSYIFIQENVFENVICEMAVLLSRPQCVNIFHADWRNYERKVFAASWISLWLYKKCFFRRLALLSARPAY